MYVSLEIHTSYIWRPYAIDVLGPSHPLAQCLVSWCETRYKTNRWGLWASWDLRDDLDHLAQGGQILVQSLSFLELLLDNHHPAQYSCQYSVLGWLGKHPISLSSTSKTHLRVFPYHNLEFVLNSLYFPTPKASEFFCSTHLQSDVQIFHTEYWRVPHTALVGWGGTRTYCLPVNRKYFKIVLGLLTTCCLKMI